MAIHFDMNRLSCLKTILKFKVDRTYLFTYIGELVTQTIIAFLGELNSKVDILLKLSKR